MDLLEFSRELQEAAGFRPEPFSPKLQPLISVAETGDEGAKIHWESSDEVDSHQVPLAESIDEVDSHQVLLAESRDEVDSHPILLAESRDEVDSHQILLAESREETDSH